MSCADTRVGEGYCDATFLEFVVVHAECLGSR